MQQFSRNFNLPWHQHDHYWISIYPKSGDFPASLIEPLQKAGLQPMADGGKGMRTGRQWKPVWDGIFNELKALGALASVEAAITPGGEPPASRALSECKPLLLVQMIADSLWLGDALLEDRVMCYLQPVVSTKDRIFGYESFARVRCADGSIISGDQVVAASRVLGIEYMIDRHLHVEAIKTFVSSEFNGFLFVNFFPGFIHRPEVYLEGLSETAKSFGVLAKHIVLDFTKAETPRDIGHIKNVCDYARSRGYSVALDDVFSIEGARKLIAEIRPDFIKIDMHLVRQVHHVGQRETIRTLVEMGHAAAGTVIAEGVETDEIFQALKGLGVDLFQGYLFSPPVPVEAALKRSGASG